MGDLRFASDVEGVKDGTCAILTHRVPFPLKHVLPDPSVV